MKCNQCRQTISLNDTYCGECGMKINQEEIRLKQKKKRWKIGISSIGMLLVFLIGCHLLLYFTSPKYVAQTYFDAVMHADYDKIYDYVKEEESLFVSKDILKEKDVQQGNIEEVEISHIYEKQNQTYVEFSYICNGRRTKSYVELQKKTYFSIFTTYKVVSGKLASNVSFVVPQNSQITIDGKEIDAFLQEDKNTGYDTYFIKSMMAGDYEVVLTLANGLQKKEMVSVKDKGTYLLTNLQLEEEQKKLLEKTNLENLNILYEAALQDKAYSTISSSFENNVESFYRQIKREVKNKNITSKKYSDCEIKNTTINKDGNIEITFFVDYTIEYMQKELYKTTNQTLTYQYKDGKFILLDE